MYLWFALFLAEFSCVQSATRGQYDWHIDLAEGLKDFHIFLDDLRRDCRSRSIPASEPLDNRIIATNYRSVFDTARETQEWVWSIREYSKRERGIKRVCDILWSRLNLPVDEFVPQIPAIKRQLLDLDLDPKRHIPVNDPDRNYEEESMRQEFEILASKCTELSTSSLVDISRTESSRYENFRKLNRQEISAARRDPEFKPCLLIWAKLEDPEKLPEIQESITESSKKGQNKLPSIFRRIIPHF